LLFFFVIYIFNNRANIDWNLELKKKLKSLDEVEPELLKTFEKLGISLTEQKRLANVAIDAVFDSISIVTTFQERIKQTWNNFFFNF